MPVFGSPGVTFDDGTSGLPCAKAYFSNVNNLNKEWLLSFTVDYNLSSKDTLRFRYKRDRGVQATGTDPINALFNANSVQPEDDGQMFGPRLQRPEDEPFIMSGLSTARSLGHQISRHRWHCSRRRSPSWTVCSRTWAEPITTTRKAAT